MRRAILVAVALSCFVVGKAAAGFIDGNSLFSACEEEARGDPGGNSPVGMCLGYILGAYDASERAAPGKIICVPTGVKAQQVRDGVKLYLRNHPDKRQLPASYLVVIALREKFPCN